VAEYKGHLRDIVRHSVHILAVLSVHTDFFPSLGKSEDVAIQLPVEIPEIDLHVERLLCVDQVIRSWSVGSSLSQMIVLGINRALAAVIASRVASIGVRILASVSSRVPSMLVSLHEVEFWAQWSILMVTISVTVAEWVTGIVDSGHENRVEVRNAAAAHIAQVHIILDDATKKVWLVER